MSAPSNEYSNSIHALAAQSKYATEPTMTDMEYSRFDRVRIIKGRTDLEEAAIGLVGTIDDVDVGDPQLPYLVVFDEDQTRLPEVSDSIWVDGTCIEPEGKFKHDLDEAIASIKRTASERE